MRALVLINAGARQAADQADMAMQQLWAMGVDVVHAHADDLADWPALIDSHADEVDCVVVGGGDGSLNFVVNSLMRHNLTLGILPLGTANDFARTLGHPVDLTAACRAVAEGVDHRVDVGQVNDVYFLNVASIGLAVRALRYRSDTAKRWFGSLGYASNLHAAFRDTRPFHARVICDGVEQELRSIQIAIGNGRYFGGGLVISDNAALDDGKLDVVSLDPQSLGELMQLLPTLLRGPVAPIQGAQLWHGKHIRVVTDRRYAINTDGEVLTHTPATFRVLPGALSVRVPKAYRAAPGPQAETSGDTA